ncbi:hypothetical protein CPn_0213 [Chlamydia pneumoniae CWL029]|uniref:Uncharacterized protein n=1 Tax=Chlamydia pneumoniae TaxID=83558 RepID=A0A0H2ULC3_CHLPN|nr:hypothetical protein CPn_0213 [Chlamydia pneumoniae CWL029]
MVVFSRVIFSNTNQIGIPRLELILPLWKKENDPFCFLFSRVEGTFIILNIK